MFDSDGLPQFSVSVDNLTGFNGLTMPRRQAATGAPGAEPRNVPFIVVTTSSAKLDPATRKQVRSYVMRGKNRKRPKALPSSAALGSWINGPPDADSHPDAQTASPQTIPPRVGHDMTHISFADDMKPYMLESTYRCA